MFQKIDFKKYLKKGLEMANEDPIKQFTVNPLWVKKCVSQREWSDRYSQDSSYCNLGSDGVGKYKQVKIGFLTANIIPRDCEMMSDEELVVVDNYRKANNIYPRPLQVRSTQKELIK